MLTVGKLCLYDVLKQQVVSRIKAIWNAMAVVALLMLSAGKSVAQHSGMFKVIGFFTGKHDAAHISFVHEANQWFTKAAGDNHFAYDSTQNWDNLNNDFLKNYQVVVFLDSRPEKPAQRAAFQKYME